jgi:hypothetical protein
VKPIEAKDLLDLVQYERVREEYRARIIALKQHRRITVGDRLSFVFENRDTVTFQIQEMLRAERIVREDAIQAEIDVYNELMPGPDELSATLMIEIPDAGRIRKELDRLIGIDEYVELTVGGEAVRAGFDPKQFEADRISAVQYVRFPLGPQLAARFGDPAVPVELRVVHPHYRAAAAIEGPSRESLARDLDSAATV